MRYALSPDCSAERHQLEIQQLAAAEDGGVVLVAVRENGSLCGFAELAIRHDHVDGASSVPVAYLVCRSRCSRCWNWSSAAGGGRTMGRCSRFK
jgi:hypothetical protein